MMAQYLLENPVNPTPPAHSDYTTIKLLVAHQLMGSIIGKSGSKIKEIQEESGAKLVISKEMLPQSTERVIEVYGSVESMYVITLC
jgi:heterogeneous nuclear rnp K-like protein 2